MKEWWSRTKNNIALRLLPESGEVYGTMVQAALHRDPTLAERLLRSNDIIWASTMQTMMMRQLGDLDATGLPTQTTQVYPVLSQLGRGGRGSFPANLPKGSPFNLRRFSEYPPVRRAIGAIASPILDMPWTIEKIADDKGSHYKARQDLSLSEQAQAMIVRNVLNNPNHVDSWRTLIWQIIEDMLVGAFGSLEVQRTQEMYRPVVLYPVDGASIRINAVWGGDPDEPRYSQSMGYLGQNTVDHQAVQLRNDELIYFRMQPRTNTPFGLGYVETAYANINAWVGAVEYAERRASNSTPNFALFLGENIDAATAQSWRHYWENQIEGYGKIPIIGGGRQPEVLNFTSGSEDQLWLKWQELLIRYIAQAFHLSSSTFNLEKDINRATATQLDADDWGAVAPVAYTISDHLTHKLIHQILGFNTLRFRWVIRDTDEKRQAEILRERYDMNAITPNEVRQHFDDQPLEDGIGNMVKSQLSGLEDAIPAIAPSLRQNRGGPSPDTSEDDAGDTDPDDAGDDGYIMDRIERLVNQFSGKDKTW